MGQYFAQPFIQRLPSASLADLTPPTFAGITGLVANSDGSLTASYSAATDATPPIEYRVYLALGSVSAATLFATTPLFSVYGLSARIYADALNAALVAGSVYTVGVRAEDAVGNVDSNTAILTQTVSLNLYSLIGAIPGQVWDQVRASHTGGTTFGGALQSKVDVDVSTRLAAAAYTAPDNADIVAIKAKTDALPADPASNTQVLTRAPAATAVSTADLTPARAAKLDNLDVAVSTRLASAGYTAPDNATIAAINAKTTNLPADPASNTQVLTRAPASTALDSTVWTNAKAAFIDSAISSRASAVDIGTALAGISAIFARTDVATSTRATPGDITAAQTALAALINAVAGNVWEQLTSAHTTAGTFGLNAQTPSLNPTQVANAVWDALTAAHTVAGSFGLSAQTPSLNPTQVANAVWDALTSAHTVAGSFGLSAQTPSLNPAQVASAVWDAILTSYAQAGTFGSKLQDILTFAQATAIFASGMTAIEGTVTVTPILEAEVGSPIIVATVTEVVNLNF